MEQTNAAIKVAVTGARGFIGARLLGPLVASGAKVRALVRSGHDRARMQATGAEVQIVPLKPGGALDKALTGQDVLVNLAYDMRAGMDENLAMFDGLIGAAEQAGIRRIVHLSSAVVYDGWPNGPLDESGPITDPQGASYRRAKILMENQLMGGDFEAAILQPTIVYGPGSALWTTAPMDALVRGGVVLPDPCGACAAVFVDDVVQTILLATQAAEMDRQRFLISGPEAVPWHQFYKGYRDLMGQGNIITKPLADLLDRLSDDVDDHGGSGPSLAARISAKLRQVIGSRRFETLMARARSLRGAQGPNWPDRHMLALYQAHPSVSIDRARAILGYEPKFDFAQGLLQIAQDQK